MTLSFFARWAVSVLLLISISHSFVAKVTPKGPFVTKLNNLVLAPMDYDAQNVGYNDISNSKLLGGNYAGVQTTVNPITGEPLPIPEDMIPEVLTEWEDVPCYQEVLTREERTGPYSLNRDLLSVYPAVGCDVDSLDTKMELIGLEFDSMITPVYETIFYYMAPRNGYNVTVVEAMLPVDLYHRMRITLTVFFKPETSTFSVRTPIGVNFERMLTRSPNDPTVSFNEPFDTEYLGVMLGKRMNSTKQTFLEQARLPWAPEPEKDPNTDHLTFVTVPGNVTVAYGQSDEITFDMFFVYMDYYHLPSVKVAVSIKDLAKL